MPGQKLTPRTTATHGVLGEWARIFSLRAGRWTSFSGTCRKAACMPCQILSTDNRATDLQGTRAACANATDGAICAALWLQSAGFVRGCRQTTGPLLQA